MLLPTKTKVAILAAPGIALALFLFVASDSKEKNTQPLAYNHKVHVGNAGLKCTECHLYAEQKASATIPTLEVCRNCHSDQPLSES
ncbi:MAG: cytochrome c3 family protein, partial [Bacteroidota bacterium]